MKLIDLTGQIFGKLTVVERGPNAERFPQPPRWYCRCSCGNPSLVLVEGADLRRCKTGNRTCEGTRTCGCGGEGIAGRKNRTHGASKTGAYRSYIDMHSRCYLEKNKEYGNYGGRGILVCARWHRDNPQGLTNFLADMGERPAHGSLERKDFNAWYSPDNCCWIPHNLQSKNTRAVRGVVVDGALLTMSDAARVLSVGPAYLSYHLGRGRPFDLIREHVATQRDSGKMSKAQEGWKHGRN